MKTPKNLPPVQIENLSAEELIELTLSQLIPSWKKLEKDEKKPLEMPMENTGMRMHGMFHGREISIDVYRLGLRFWLDDRRRNAKTITELITRKICKDLNIPVYIAS